MMLKINPETSSSLNDFDIKILSRSVIHTKYNSSVNNNFGSSLHPASGSNVGINYNPNTYTSIIAPIIPVPMVSPTINSNLKLITIIIFINFNLEPSFTNDNTSSTDSNNNQSISPIFDPVNKPNPTPEIYPMFFLLACPNNYSNTTFNT